MGPWPSRPRPSTIPTLRKSELVELSSQLSVSDVNEVLHRLSPSIPHARIEASRGSPDKVFRLLQEWHRSCGTPSKARAELSVALSRARRQDLADELEAHKILHISLCRQTLVQKYERFLDEEGWKDNTYIKPTLKQTTGVTTPECSRFCATDFLKIPGKTILIEGEVGVGKTMLMRSLLAEWIRGYKQGESLPLLFLLATDRITADDTIQSAIHRQYFGECNDITENELADYICNVPEGSLIAIDAVPDMRTFLRTHIGKSLLNRTEMSNNAFSLIMTSRPEYTLNFDFAMSFKINPFSPEDVEKYVMNAFSSNPQNEQTGRKLVRFLQDASSIRDDLCSIPLLCGVMCRLWSVCLQQEESHLLKRIEICSSITGFSNLVAEALVRENITDIQPNLTPTPMFRFRALLQDTGDCGITPEVEVVQTMENLGKVAFRKLKKDSLSFPEGAFASCPRSYKIACYTRVLVKKGSSTEFFHPIIEAYCVAAYLNKLHNSSTTAFKEALCELDAIGSSYRKWVYRYLSGNTDTRTARDVIGHLAVTSTTHNLLSECLGEALCENLVEEQDTSPNFDIIAWPSHIILEDPTEATLSGFYLALGYATGLSQATIRRMSLSDAENIRSHYFLQNLQNLELKLTSLVMTKCQLSLHSLLFKLLTPESLRLLDLSNSTATADLTDAPDVFFSRLPDLTTLRLPDIDQYPCLLLASLSERCPALQELSVSFQRPCSHGGECKICHRNFQELKSLSIKGGSSVASQHLANVISCATALENLSMKCVGITEGFIESLATLQQVQKAQLKFANLEAASLDRLLNKLPHLKHVNLAFGGRHEAEILHMFTVLASIRNLNELNVKYSPPDTSDAHRLPSTPVKLREVHELLRNLSHLQTLTMTDVPLGDTAALDVLQDVKSEKIPVTQLRLIRCKTQSYGPYESICKDIQKRGCDVNIVHEMPGCADNHYLSVAPLPSGERLSLSGTSHDPVADGHPWERENRASDEEALPKSPSKWSSRPSWKMAKEWRKGKGNNASPCDQGRGSRTESGRTDGRVDQEVNEQSEKPKDVKEHLQHDDVDSASNLEKNLERSSFGACASIHESSQRVIRLEKHQIEVQAPPSEPWGVENITVRAITEVPPELLDVLQENQAIICAGLEMTPSDAKFSTPVKVTMPHSASFTKLHTASVGTYYRKSSSDSFSLISFADGDSRCVVRERDLDLYIDHFSEWWIIAFITRTFLGKRVICTPFVPESSPRNAQHRVRLCIRDNNIREAEPEPGYLAPIKGEEFFIAWRSGELKVTCIADNKEICINVREEKLFHKSVEVNIPFVVNTKNMDKSKIFLRFILEQSTKIDIVCPMYLSDGTSSPMPSQRSQESHETQPPSADQSNPGDEMGLVSLPVILPHTLQTRLCLLLRPTASYSGNDWRALAERFQLDKYTAAISTHPNPVEVLFRLAAERRCFTSLQELIAVFTSIEREDCADEVRRYLEHVNDEYSSRKA